MEAANRESTARSLGHRVLASALLLGWAAAASGAQVPQGSPTDPPKLVRERVGPRPFAAPKQQPQEQPQQAQAPQRTAEQVAAQAARRVAEKARRAKFARATQMRKAAQKAADEREHQRMLIENRRNLVLGVIAKRRYVSSERKSLLRNMAETRDRAITEDTAYRFVSRKKSKPVPKIKLTFTSNRSSRSAMEASRPSFGGRGGRRGGGGGGRRGRF